MVFHNLLLWGEVYCKRDNEKFELLINRLLRHLIALKRHSEASAAPVSSLFPFPLLVHFHRARKLGNRGRGRLRGGSSSDCSELSRGLSILKIPLIRAKIQGVQESVEGWWQSLRCRWDSRPRWFVSKAYNTGLSRILLKFLKGEHVEHVFRSRI